MWKITLACGKYCFWQKYKMSFALSFQKSAKPCGKTERKLRETPDFGEMCVKSTQSKRVRKRSDEKSTCEVVENSDLSTAKSTGCGKVEISTRVFNRVWKTVLINYICRKLPLWKRQWETFGKGCKAFFLCYFNPHPPVTFQSTSPRWWGRKKGLRPFRLIKSTAVEGCSYAEVRTNEQARSRDSNAVSLWIYACGGVWLIWDSFGVAPVNSSVARVRISLSSGISMFARER